MEETKRNIEQITEDVLSYKNMIADSAIEIGKLMIEAKAVLKHGEWLKWLEEKVEFSQRTAEEYMQVAKLYEGKSRTFANLEKSKLLILAKLSDNERETFMQQNDVKNMSCRNMEKKIEEFKQNSGIWKVVDAEQDHELYEVKISDLKPIPGYNRYLPDITGEDYIRFLQSIIKSGVINPIMITRDNTIISGHQRVRACKDLGIETIKAQYLYVKDTGGLVLKDLLLHEFFFFNSWLRSSYRLLAKGWDEQLFGDEEKAKKYFEEYEKEKAEGHDYKVASATLDRIAAKYNIEACA